MLKKSLPEEWHLDLMQLLALCGLIVSYYLWLFHEGSLVAACSGSGWDDCGKVSGPDAPYSTIGPIPVAYIGLAGYALIYLLIAFRGWHVWLRENLPELLIAFTGIGLLFSVWLTGLELFVIHAFCRYCVVSAIIAVLLFLLAVVFLRAVNAAES